MMHLSWWLNFFNLPPEDTDVSSRERQFYRVISAALTFIPLILIFNFLGFGLVYILAFFGILDVADTKLLTVGTISLLLGLLHFPLYPLLRQRRLQIVALLLFLLDGLGRVSQVFLWQNFAIPLALLVFALVVVFLRFEGLDPRYKISITVIGAVFFAAILYFNSQIQYARLPLANISSMAGLSIYAIIILMNILLILVNAIYNFKTIAARLVTTFAFITIMSAVATLVIAALGNFYYSREQVFVQLKGVSDIKQSQIGNILTAMDNEISIPIKDPLTYQRIQFLLQAKRDNFSYQFNYDLIRANFVKLREQSNRYDEIFIVDSLGQVLISTTRNNEKQFYTGQRFFTRVLQGETFTIDTPPTGTASTSLLIMKPIEKNGAFIGAIVARSSLNEIKAVMETKTGIASTLETYLVGTDYTSVTVTRAGAGTLVSTDATINAIGSSNTLAGKGIYANYQQEAVLGNYAYIPAIETVLVSEVKQQEVVGSILRLIFSNLGVGFFTALMAFAIVFVTSRSISGPITDLVVRANRLAKGDMSASLTVDRQDEIGQLEETFNTVASELQILIQTLEQKVTDRTEDLQKQASRLRVAAEVARDATTARSLDELLNRSAQLVLDRFDFYHTGIFLIDARHEYAVLRASPTEAGRAMLERKHQLKVGQVGIVGSAAASGEPHIALDTGHDATYFDNPLLPNTRSEMGLPLKVNDQVIGVLDVQSEKAEAFNQDDIASLQIMADQLALAIQRAQLVEQLQKNLADLELAYQQFTLSSWRNFSNAAQNHTGYQFDGTKIIALNNLPTETADVIRQGKSALVSQSGENKTMLAVPVKLRDQVIGALKLEFNSATLSAETVKLAEEIAARLAVALENARLYTESKNQAARDRLASEISTKIGSSINIENILRTTVQELGRITPGAEVIVKIKKEQES